MTDEKIEKKTRGRKKPVELRPPEEVGGSMSAALLETSPTFDVEEARHLLEATTLLSPCPSIAPLEPGPDVKIVRVLGPFVQTTEKDGALINFGDGPVASIIPPIKGETHATVHLVMNGGLTRYKLSAKVWEALKARLEVIGDDPA